MSRQSFDHILTLIRPHITKQDTVMRKAIEPGLKLAVTLHHLATHADAGTIHKHWRIGKSTAIEAIQEVCRAIWSVMAPVYLKPPSSDADWKSIAEG